MSKSLLTDAEILQLFKVPTRIGDIAIQAGVTRQAIWYALKRTGHYDPIHGSSDRVCRFCGETYRVWRNQIKRGGDGFGYCSVQCFHADRSVSGEYSKIGGQLARVNEVLRRVDPVTDRKLGRLAANALADNGIKLQVGEVVHHKDFDRRNFDIDNLQIFKNQSEHMKFHHSLRPKK